MKKNVLCLLTFFCFWSSVADAGTIVLMRDARHDDYAMRYGKDGGCAGAWYGFEKDLSRMDLTDLEIDMIKCSARHLYFMLPVNEKNLPKVFSSPLPYAKETAKLMASTLHFYTKKFAETSIDLGDSIPVIEDSKLIPKETVEELRPLLRSFLEGQVKPLFHDNEDASALVIADERSILVMLQILGQDISYNRRVENAEFVIVRDVTPE